MYRCLQLSGRVCVCVQVALLMNEPYTMLKLEPGTLQGNDRYEGFCVDLFNAIAEHLHFNVTYKIVSDGNVS